MPETLIQSQQEMDAFIGRVVEDFNNVRMTPFLEDEQRRMEVAHQNYFNRMVSPAGALWRGNAKSTIRRKGHERILVGLTGRLKASLTTQASEYGIRYEFDNWPAMAKLIFGTDAPYHGFNEFGTKRAPARPHLGIDESYLDRMLQRTLDHVFTGIKHAQAGR